MTALKLQARIHRQPRALILATCWWNTTCAQLP